MISNTQTKVGKVVSLQSLKNTLANVKERRVKLVRLN